MASQHERGANDASSREQSPDLGEVERERVRQIVRGWMETGISDHSSNVAPWTNVMAVGMVKLNMPLWIINVEAAGMYYSENDSLPCLAWGDLDEDDN
ncbi:hypothetical protein GBA52_009767 [Prunus armeniaca]|nr:hypothetical protein GBA52_009767 [Prunus armeniaca]